MTKLRKDAVLIANQISYDGSGVPIEFVEAQTQADGGNLSARFGTIRDPQSGKAYLFSVASRIDVIAGNGDISSVSALDETGAIVALTATYATDRYQITGVDGNYYWNIKCWANSVTPTDEQRRAYTLEESGGESNLFAWYRADEGSSDKAIDISNKDNHGLIINLYVGFHTTQNIYSWQEDEGYTISDGISYYYDQALTQLIPVSVLIPKLSTSVLPPFKCAAYIAGGLRGDLQYIGKNPSRLKIVEGNCFQGGESSLLRRSSAFISTKQNIEISGIAVGVNDGMICGRYNPALAHYFSISRVGSTNITLTAYSENIEVINLSIDIGIEPIADFLTKIYGTTVSLTVNGTTVGDTTTWTTGLRISGAAVDYTVGNTDNGSSAYEGQVYINTINDLNVSGVFIARLARWVFCEKIYNAGSHTYHDVGVNSGVPTGNHLTLINGAYTNQGVRALGDESQKGLLDDGTKQVPILEDGATFADGTDLSNPDARLQDGYSFIKTSDVAGEGTKLEAYPVPRLELNGRYLDISGVPKKLAFSDFSGVETGDKDFSDVSETNKVRQIRGHRTALTGKQLDTEKRITNNL